MSLPLSPGSWVITLTIRGACLRHEPGNSQSQAAGYSFIFAQETWESTNFPKIERKKKRNDVDGTLFLLKQAWIQQQHRIPFVQMYFSCLLFLAFIAMLECYFKKVNGNINFCNNINYNKLLNKFRPLVRKTKITEFIAGDSCFYT